MSKPLDYFKYINGTLFADGVALAEVADLVGTPVYVYSASGFLSPLRALQKGLRGLDHQICFAVKANSNISILRLLARAGAGMDVVSGGELYRAATAGVLPNRVVFSGVGKTPGEIAAALRYGKSGILSFNVESAAELELINAVAEDLGKIAPVSLRFNPDIDAKTHPYISTGLKRNKFGLERKEILEVIERFAKNSPAYSNLQLQGLSIHIGSQLLSLSPIRDSFKSLRKLVEEIEKILPQPLSLLDLGGGLGITYKNERALSIAQYCELVQKYFGKKSGLKYPKQILLEPGRVLAGNAGVLLTSVLHRKPRKKKDFLIVDAAMNDLIRPALYGSEHTIAPIEEALVRSPHKATDVVGPICETSDCLATNRALSTQIEEGDLLAVLSTGAYGFSMSGNYNSRPRPAEILLEDGKISLIRERETFEDLIRGENTKGRT